MWTNIFLVVGLITIIKRHTTVGLWTGLGLILNSFVVLLEIAPEGIFSFFFSMCCFSMPLWSEPRGLIKDRQDLLQLLGMLGFLIWEGTYCLFWWFSIEVHMDVLISLVCFALVLAGAYKEGAYGNRDRRYYICCYHLLPSVFSKRTGSSY